MNGEAIITVSAATVALVQFAKWSGVPDKQGPVVVLALSLLGVVFWGFSVGSFERTQLFPYFAGWISVATSAAGVFGFTRAASASLTSIKEPPPGGAGSSATVKS